MTVFPLVTPLFISLTALFTLTANVFSHFTTAAVLAFCVTSSCFSRRKILCIIFATVLASSSLCRTFCTVGIGLLSALHDITLPVVGPAGPEETTGLQYVIGSIPAAG